MKTLKTVRLVVALNLLICTSFSPGIFIPNFDIAAKTDAITTIRDVCSSGCTYTSIQAAIDDADPGDIIDLAAETYTEPIVINEEISLEGEGAANTILQAAANVNSATDRVIRVVVTATATIDGVTIRHGNGVTKGGGIHNRGTLTVTNSIITRNKVSESGYGAGIFNLGKGDGDAHLTIVASVISSNTIQSGFYGAGIYNYADDREATINLIDSSIVGNSTNYAGGGICNWAQQSDATFNLTGSSVSGNSAGLHGGGIHINANSGGKSTLTLIESSVENNSTGYSGGGIYQRAGISRATINLTRSTISNNEADRGGGIYNYAYYDRAFINLTNSTISNNTADISGAIENQGDHGNAELNITASTISTNTATTNYGGLNHYIVSSGTGNAEANVTGSIFANNTNGDCRTNTGSGAVFNNNGYNIIETGGGNCGTAGDGDPMLGPLQDNGGPTFTHALLTGSPAIDAIPNAACMVFTDQRGNARPFGVDCDIGSYEFGWLIFLPLVFR